MLSRIGVFLFLSIATTAVSAQQSGAHENCMFLSGIAEKAFRAKEDGSSLAETKNAIHHLLLTQPGLVSSATYAAAEGYVLAIYEDDEIKSAKKAGETVYESCINK